MVYIELETVTSDLLAQQVVLTALLTAMTSSFTQLPACCYGPSSTGHGSGLSYPGAAHRHTAMVATQDGGNDWRVAGERMVLLDRRH
jgi:hypothetical protein